MPRKSACNLILKDKIKENKTQDSPRRQIGFLPHNYLGRVEKRPGSFQAAKKKSSLKSEFEKCNLLLPFNCPLANGRLVGWWEAKGEEEEGTDISGPFIPLQKLLN